MPGFGKEKPKPARPPNVTRAGIEAAALRYLERFDCSIARLRKVLQERVAKAARAGVAEAALAPAIVEELLLRYQSSGLLDDRRFASNFAINRPGCSTIGDSPATSPRDSAIAALRGG